MTFDKSKVYTALNADELHAGDTVYVADTLFELRLRVEDEIIEPTFDIIHIRDDDCIFRFDVGDEVNYMLAYLVKRG